MSEQRREQGTKTPLIPLHSLYYSRREGGRSKRQFVVRFVGGVRERKREEWAIRAIYKALSVMIDGQGKKNLVQVSYNDYTQITPRGRTACSPAPPARFFTSYTLELLERSSPQAGTYFMAAAGLSNTQVFSTKKPFHFRFASPPRLMSSEFN